MRNNLSATILGLLGLAMLPTCGASNDETPDVDGEKPSLSAIGGQAASITHAKAISRLFVNEDPTLNMSMTAAQNAANVNAQALTSIASACSSAAIHFDTTSLTVSVDFGDSCTLPKVGKVSGRVTAQVTKPDASRIGVAFTFTGLTVNGRTIDGTWSVRTSDARIFVIDCVLTSSKVTLTLNAVTLTLDSDSSGVTLTGSGGVSGPIVGALTLTFDGVHQAFLSCYPNAGAIRFTKNLTIAGRAVGITESLTFDSDTPTTGKVRIAVGSLGGDISLPAYGHCPP